MGLQGLFYICEYFGITPQQLFDEGNALPVQLVELVDNLQKIGCFDPVSYFCNRERTFSTSNANSPSGKGAIDRFLDMAYNPSIDNNESEKMP